MEEPTLQLRGVPHESGALQNRQPKKQDSMSKHRQQRPNIHFKWWTRYALYLATTLLIKATQGNKQHKTRHNRTK